MFIHTVNLERSTSDSSYVPNMFFMDYSCFWSTVSIYLALWSLEEQPRIASAWGCSAQRNSFSCQ